MTSLWLHVSLPSPRGSCRGVSSSIWKSSEPEFRTEHVHFSFFQVQIISPLAVWLLLKPGAATGCLGRRFEVPAAHVGGSLGSSERRWLPSAAPAAAHCRGRGGGAQWGQCQGRLRGVTVVAMPAQHKRGAEVAAQDGRSQGGSARRPELGRRCGMCAD